VRSLSILLTGTVVAQGLTLAFTLALARVYEPVAYGQYTLFLATFAVVSGLARLSLDKAIVFARTDAHAQALTGAAIVAAAALGILWMLGGTLLWLSSTLIAGVGAYRSQVLAVGFGVVASAGYQAHVQLRLYFKDPTAVATAKVTQSASRGAAQLALHPVLGPIGLVVGDVVGGACAIVPLVTRRRRSALRLPGLSVGPSLVAVTREHAKYVLFVTPSTVLDALSNQLPLYVIASLFLEAVLGQYGMALRVLAAPAGVFGVAVGQWYLQQTARELNADHERLRLLLGTWKRLALLGLVPFGAVLLFGEPIFGAVFGERWTEAGIFARILSPLLFLKFVSSPTSTIYYQLGLQKLLLLFTLAMVVARPLAMYWGGTQYGVYGGVIVMALVEVVQILLYNAIAVHKLRS
jgi:O-antigen/teichoic acid export membrane protein